MYITHCETACEGFWANQSHEYSSTHGNAAHRNGIYVGSLLVSVLKYDSILTHNYICI